MLRNVFQMFLYFKGLQDDQRYSQLLALRARTANGGNSALSATQMNQLRNQIMAYRCLARNQPIPQSILMSLQVSQRFRFVEIVINYFFNRVRDQMGHHSSRRHLQARSKVKDSLVARRLRQKLLQVLKHKHLTPLKVRNFLYSYYKRIITKNKF